MTKFFKRLAIRIEIKYIEVRLFFIPIKCVILCKIYDIKSKIKIQFLKSFIDHIVVYNKIKNL